MQLSKLFPGQPDIEINGLTLDSRTAKEGYIFFCINGYEMDGHKFAGSAVDNGASVVVHTKDLTKKDGVIYIRVDNMNHEINRVSDLFFGSPSHKLKVFGVTGTNGKSTITSIISDIYSHYIPCGYMGTIAVRYGDYARVPNLTTPDQIETHSNLREMLDNGMKAVSMEVSSQGLDRGRVDSVDFDCALFTNITHDHLDYHKTMENYLMAKARLFKNLKPSAVAILNIDDHESFQPIRDLCNCKVVTYGTDRASEEQQSELSKKAEFHSSLNKNTDPESKEISNDRTQDNSDSCTIADYYGRDIVLHGTSTEFTLCHKQKEYRIHTNLSALYNVYNLIGAIASMHEMGMPLDMIVPLLNNIPQVDGRMESVDMNQDFSVIVDYAHTPDAYEKIFGYARETTKDGGRVIACFGCPGKRDTAKRPVMGEIAGRNANMIFLTSQDPRNSDPSKIAEDISKGIDLSGCPHIFIEDRQEAITAAINFAKKDDIVIILGKGGETYMYHTEGRRPWITDKKAAEIALKNL